MLLVHSTNIAQYVIPQEGSGHTHRITPVTARESGDPPGRSAVRIPRGALAPMWGDDAK